MQESQREHMKLAASILALLALNIGAMGEVVPRAEAAKVIACDYSSKGRVDAYGTNAIIQIGDTQYQVEHVGTGDQCVNLRLIVGSTIWARPRYDRSYHPSSTFSWDTWKPTSILIDRQKGKGVIWVDFLITDYWSVK